MAVRPPPGLIGGCILKLASCKIIMSPIGSVVSTYETAYWERIRDPDRAPNEKTTRPHPGPKKHCRISGCSWIGGNYLYIDWS